jgi:molybdenum cofactor cytidylyltransferase
MRFGEIPLDEAEGAILAHNQKAGARTLKKGRALTAEDVATLREAGHAEIVGARLDADDIGENEAAALLARAAAGEHVKLGDGFTGRANLFADAPGVLVFDQERLDRFNLVDEAVTAATLPRWAVVEPKQMVATVKIIPFAAPRAVVETCAAVAADGGPLIRVAAFAPHRVALIQTVLPGLKESVLDKTEGVTAERVAALGSYLAEKRRCRHEPHALVEALRETVPKHDLVLVASASAIVDRRDVIPSAITGAGGRVEHFGMPVDPGNLLLLGRIGDVPVLGLPGCARSPKVNGFDWVLQRLLAKIPVGAQDVMRMGAGGLLAEIPSRPLPRAEASRPPEKPALPRAPRIAALVLAAGQSRRMGEINKLLVEVDGKPMARRVVEAVASSSAAPVIVVLGHEAARVAASLDGLPVQFVENPDYAGGLSTSLRRGLAALPDDVDGALVCLGDMPRIKRQDIERLIGAFNPVEGRAIVVPTRRGKRGNPVLWGKRLFAEMREVAGDVGARHLIGAYPELVAEVEIKHDGVLLDIDTPQALADLATTA